MRATRTFPLILNSSYVAGSILEICHLRDMTFDADERVGVYLEAIYAMVNVQSFALQKFPKYDGSESEEEKVSKFYKAQADSHKIGFEIYGRKNNLGNWNRKTQIIVTNVGRSQNLDFLPLYLAQAGVRILEANDALAIKLVDYGNGLLKSNDELHIEFALSLEVEKKNNLNAVNARIEGLELALSGKITNVPANTLLGRNSTIGTVEAIPQSNFAKPSDIDTAIFNLIGGAPGALNTLDELANALADDASFATTVANQITTTNNQISALAALVTLINAPVSITLTGALNVAANTWFNVGIFNNVGIASTVGLYALSVHIQYGDGTSSFGHWQYAGGTLISSIQWKAGGTQIATSFKMEVHNGGDFTCFARFALNNANRNLQLSFDIPITTQAPTTLRVTLRRVM